jgi:superfamily I DNA/RNA helicase
VAAGAQKFAANFLWAEWHEVVDARQLRSWEEYRDVRRLGRKTRLAESQRAVLWSVFEHVRSVLQAAKLVTRAAMFTALAGKLRTSPRPVFDHVVVDESQDLGIPELRFLAALGATRPNGLFFTGDLGQRIFQQPFSWIDQGVDVRGRSTRLRVNYRTSHQIRRQADLLLGSELSDVDGVVEERKGTISAFNGVPPTVAIAKSVDDERKAVATWLKERMDDGLRPHELAVFVRSSAQLERARQAVESAGLPFLMVDDCMVTTHGQLSILTMHLAKGLEFRGVAVMACDDEILPLQERVESASEESDLEEVYQTERHLLYVACTRARDFLLVSGVAPGSEFLGDLRGRNDGAVRP